MGARFEEDNEMHNPDAFKDEDLEIFSNIGKFEKKIGLSVNEKEIYVVNKQVDEDIWINLDTWRYPKYSSFLSHWCTIVYNQTLGQTSSQDYCESSWCFSRTKKSFN